MTSQRQFLLNLPRLSGIKPFGAEGVQDSQRQVYVLLRLPRGGHWLALNRCYEAIGYLTPADARKARKVLAKVASSGEIETWEWGGSDWKDATYYVFRSSNCPNCGDHVNNAFPKPRKCNRCGRFVKV